MDPEGERREQTSPKASLAAQNCRDYITLHMRQELLPRRGILRSRRQALELSGWWLLGSRTGRGLWLVPVCVCVHVCTCACIVRGSSPAEAPPDSFQPFAGPEASGHPPTCSLSTLRSATFSCPSPRPLSSSSAASISGGSLGRQVDLQGSLLLEGGGRLWQAMPAVEAGLG